MGRTLTTICAQCGKVATISDNVRETTAANLANLMPEDWRKVYVDFGNIGGRVENEVCSFECAMNWVQKQLDQSRENANQITSLQL